MELDLRIQSLKDLGEKGPAFPELGKKPLEEIAVVGVAILERGTHAGRSSLFFHGFDRTGKVLAFQLTASMFEMIYGALHGAEARWKEERETRK